MFATRVKHTLELFQEVKQLRRQLHIERGIELRSSLVMHNDRYVMKCVCLVQNADYFLLQAARIRAALERGDDAQDEYSGGGRMEF